MNVSFEPIKKTCKPTKKTFTRLNFFLYFLYFFYLLISVPLFFVLARNRNVTLAPVIVPKNANASPDNSLTPITLPNNMAITDIINNTEAVICAILVDTNLLDHGLLLLLLRCKRCGKTCIHAKRAYCWQNFQLCGRCYFKNVLILKGNSFTYNYES